VKTVNACTDFQDIVQIKDNFEKAEAVEFAKTLQTNFENLGI
jgi:hypothetical protein